MRNISKVFAAPLLAFFLLQAPAWASGRRARPLQPRGNPMTAPPRLPMAPSAPLGAMALAAAEEPSRPPAKAALERMGAELASASAHGAAQHGRDLGGHFTGARKHRGGEAGLAGGGPQTAPGTRLLGRDEGLLSGLLSSAWILSLRGETHGPVEHPEHEFAVKRGIGNAIAAELRLLTNTPRVPRLRNDLAEISERLLAASADGEGDKADWSARLAAQYQAFRLAAERLGRLQDRALPKDMQVSPGRMFVRGVLAGLRPAAAALAADIPVAALAGGGRAAPSQKTVARHFDLRRSVGLAAGLTLESLAKRYPEPKLRSEVERLAQILRNAPDTMDGNLEDGLRILKKQQEAFQNAAKGLRALERAY